MQDPACGISRRASQPFESSPSRQNPIHIPKVGGEQLNLLFPSARRNRFGTRKQPRSLMQRFVIFLLIGGIGFLTLVIVMMKLGRASADNDPSLDPKFNPHIRVGQ